jgi:hypothetical protein
MQYAGTFRTTRVRLKNRIWNKKWEMEDDMGQYLCEKVDMGKCDNHSQIGISYTGKMGDHVIIWDTPVAYEDLDMVEIIIRHS